MTRKPKRLDAGGRMSPAERKRALTWINSAVRRSAALTHHVQHTYKNTAEVKLRANGCIVWYVAWTNPGCEKRAALSLEAKGYGAFLPIRTVRGRIFRRIVFDREYPLFPRYVFFALRPGQEFYLVRSAYGVESILRNHEDMPQKVPTEAVDELRALQASGVWDSIEWPPVARPIDPGTHVQVVDGPFANFHAVVTATLSSKTVEVLVDIFGRKTPVKLPLAAVRVAC